MCLFQIVSYILQSTKLESKQRRQEQKIRRTKEGIYKEIGKKEKKVLVEKIRQSEQVHLGKIKRMG